MVDLGKLIVATGFEKLPKIQYIAQSGHTDRFWPKQSCPKYNKKLGRYNLHFVQLGRHLVVIFEFLLNLKEFTI